MSVFENFIFKFNQNFLCPSNSRRQSLQNILLTGQNCVYFRRGDLDSSFNFNMMQICIVALASRNQTVK